MIDLDDPRSRVVGTKQVLRALRKSDDVQKVYVAEDADESVKLTVMRACESGRIRAENVTTMRELGDACGIKVGAATAAVLKTTDSQKG